MTFQNCMFRLMQKTFFKVLLNGSLFTLFWLCGLYIKELNSNPKSHDFHCEKMIK